MDTNPTIVFSAPKQVVIEELEVPVPDPDELLIRTRRSLISTGTELTVLKRESGEKSAWATYGRFPFKPGYNNVGEVVDVGKNVDSAYIGKRVGTYGRHARYVTMVTDHARSIPPDSITDDHAAFFTIAEIVMNGVRRGEVIWGEHVVIYGAGLLGQLTARLCRLAGARPVFVVDLADSRLSLLPDDPRIIPINPKKDDLVATVKEHTRDRMADVVFEVTGNGKLIPEEPSSLKAQGRFVILSSPDGVSQFDFFDLCNSPSYTIIGAHNFSHPPVETPGNPWTQHRHTEMFFDLLAEGSIDIERLVSRRSPYTDAPDIYRELLEDRTQAMGIVLEWD